MPLQFIVASFFCIRVAIIVDTSIITTSLINDDGRERQCIIWDEAKYKDSLADIPFPADHFFDRAVIFPIVDVGAVNGTHRNVADHVL